MRRAPVKAVRVRGVVIHNPSVVIMSYPRSGLNWLRYALWIIRGQLFQNPQVPEEKERLVHLEHDSQGLPRSRKFQSNDRKKWFGYKVIFLARDPRDIFVSNYFNLHFREKIFESTLGAFIRHRVWGVDNFLRWAWAWQASISRLSGWKFTCYEDFHADFESELYHILEFTGFRHMITESILRNFIKVAALKSTFEKMQKVENEKGRLFKDLSPRKADDATAVVRRGKVGGYKNYFILSEDLCYLNDRLKGLPPFLDRYRNESV